MVGSKNNPNYANTTDKFTPEDLEALKPEMMVRILGTQDRNGKPNLGFIPLMRNAWPDKVAFGEFVVGKTKLNLEQHDPRAGLLFMTLGFDEWNAKGTFSHWEYEGDDYELLNSAHLLRYNAYTGISRVGYINIDQVVGRRKVPLVKILSGVIAGKLAAGTLRRNLPEERMSPFIQMLFGALGNAKYTCWIGDDGFPEIATTIQMQTVDPNRLVIVPTMFKDDLTRIHEGAWVACLALHPKDFTIMQVKGIFQGFRKVRGITTGIIDVEEVYSSIAPKAGDRIYPLPVPGHLFGIEGMYARHSATTE